MTTIVFGGTGFIGRRLVSLLASRGEEVACVDVNPPPKPFVQDGAPIQYIRRDVSRFEEVMAVTAEIRPSRVVNLAYLLGSDHPPHVALRVNILGMDNCFEAARLLGINRVIFGSSIATSGEQEFFGDRPVTEDDYRYAHVQYGAHKIFNEWQAQDYRDKYGMEITAVRPANVTGPDKILGSVEHVRCITVPAQGEPIVLPYEDFMRCPIYVDDMAEIFARIVMTDKPRHFVYQSGGTPISLGGIANLVREYIPDAEISFEHSTGGREKSGIYRIDNSRVIEEFGVEFRPYRDSVLQIINAVREEHGLPLVEGAAGEGGK